MLILWWGGFFETRAGESVNIWLHWLNHDLGALWVAVNCGRVRVLMIRPMFFCIVAIPAWRKRQEGSAGDVRSLRGNSCVIQKAAVCPEERMLEHLSCVSNSRSWTCWPKDCGPFHACSGFHREGIHFCTNLLTIVIICEIQEIVLFFVFLCVVLSADLMNTEVEYLHVQWVLGENCKEPWQNLLCLCDTDGQGGWSGAFAVSISVSVGIRPCHLLVHSLYGDMTL